MNSPPNLALRLLADATHEGQLYKLTVQGPQDTHTMQPSGGGWRFGLAMLLNVFAWVGLVWWML